MTDNTEKALREYFLGSDAPPPVTLTLSANAARSLLVLLHGCEGRDWRAGVARYGMPGRGADIGAHGIEIRRRLESLAP